VVSERPLFWIALPPVNVRTWLAERPLPEASVEVAFQDAPRDPRQFVGESRRELVVVKSLDGRFQPIVLKNSAVAATRVA